MTAAALLALMLALVGNHAPDGIVVYRDAIIAATDDDAEQRALASIGLRENTYHLHAEHLPFTPPFGLTDRESHGLPRLTIAASAVVAVRVLRHHRRVCASLGAPSWGAALGRFHHGTRGERAGCWLDGLARLQVRDVGLTP